VASRWALQLDERGKPIAVLETNNDITGRKQAEEALQKAQSELADVTRVTTLGEMTASIAHEINQPLAAVVNNASACLRWLAAQNLEEARQSASLVIADGHRAGEIISGIRALVKRAPPQKNWVSINETILEVIALAQRSTGKSRRSRDSIVRRLAARVGRSNPIAASDSKSSDERHRSYERGQGPIARLANPFSSP
jgi:C4-dicarboxylate-specific signal transduction histidine kinase